MLRLRLRGPAGATTISIDGSSHFSALQTLVFDSTAIPASRQDYRIGFPPKPLASSTRPETTLLELGIQSGDQIAVAELPPSNSSLVASSPAATPVRPTPVTQPNPTVKAMVPPVKDTRPLSGLSVEVDGGFLVLRVVPDDNSCLFTSIGLVLEQGRRTGVATYLRSIVAEAIKSSPETWNEAVLGRSPASYIGTILDKNAWGGAIELSIFSDHYQHEIVSVDVPTGRIDRFGEGKNYEHQILLVYSGIHYDALTFSYVEPSRTNAFPPELDFDTTVFSTNSDEIILAALQLVKKLKRLHYYTDAATFTLKCEICQEALVGEKEARAHAQRTSHQSFGEYDG